MSTVKDRIYQLIDAKKIGVREFTDAIGVSESYIRNISKSISAEKLMRIRQLFPDLNAEWLLTGNGDMFLAGSVKMNVKTRIQAFADRKGLSYRELSESIGVSPGYINSISKSIGPDKLSTLSAKYPDLDIAWLLTGEGSMFLSDNSRSPAKSVVSSIKGRVYSLIKYKRLSVRDFERACGLSNGAVSKMGNDTRRSTLNKICTAFPDVNPEWLLAGIGTMLLSDNPKSMVATEMSSVRGRVYSFIEKKRLSVRDFERSIGASNGYVGSIRRSIGAEKLSGILSAYPDLNRDWLLYGEGSMLLSDNPKSTAIPINAPEVVYLPVVPHSARAGTLGEYEQLFADDYSRRQPVIVTRQMHGRYICFQIEGDSMEPTLRHGDVVMARHIDRDLYKDSKLHLRSWSVWIIVTRTDGILIKEIADHDVKGGVLTLHSLNPLYEDFTVHLSDVINIYNVIEIVSRHL